MNIKIEVYDEDILLATRSTELWEIAEQNLASLRKEFEAANKEQQLQDEHEDN